MGSVKNKNFAEDLFGDLWIRMWVLAALMMTRKFPLDIKGRRIPLTRIIDGGFEVGG